MRAFSIFRGGLGLWFVLFRATVPDRRRTTPPLHNQGGGGEGRKEAAPRKADAQGAEYLEAPEDSIGGAAPLAQSGEAAARLCGGRGARGDTFLFCHHGLERFKRTAIYRRRKKEGHHISWHPSFRHRLSMYRHTRLPISSACRSSVSSSALSSGYSFAFHGFHRMPSSAYRSARYSTQA